MDELEKLFNVLTRDGYYTKSFEEFQSQYNDPAYRDKVFGVVTRDGLYTNSREEFDVKYSPSGAVVEETITEDPLKKKKIRNQYRKMVYRNLQRLKLFLNKLKLKRS